MHGCDASGSGRTAATHAEASCDRDPRKEGTVSLLLDGTGTLASWIGKEVDLRQSVKSGARGQAVTRIQEWLNLHGFGLAIDSDFRPGHEAKGAGISGRPKYSGYRHC